MLNVGTRAEDVILMQGFRKGPQRANTAENDENATVETSAYTTFRHRDVGRLDSITMIALRMQSQLGWDSASTQRAYECNANAVQTSPSIRLDMRNTPFNLLAHSASEVPPKTS
jgi:hypothetical protein